LPQLYFVSFWIDGPGKLPVLGIVDLQERCSLLRGPRLSGALVNRKSSLDPVGQRR
jgi:hypothetical protein